MRLFGFEIGRIGAQNLPAGHRETTDVGIVPIIPLRVAAADPQPLIPTQPDANGNFVFSHEYIHGVEVLAGIPHELTTSQDISSVSIKCRKIAIIKASVSVFELFETENGQRFAWESFPPNKFVTGSGIFLTEAEAIVRAERCGFSIDWEPDLASNEPSLQR